MRKVEFMKRWIEQNSAEPMPASNEIWYYATEKITPNTIGGIESHNFENGKGIITVIQNENMIRNWFGKKTTVTEIRFGSQLTTMDSSGVFQNMSSLEKVILPSGLTEIADYAFRYSSLREILIPETVENIGAFAFTSCQNLALTSLPSRITSITNRCFAYCTNLALTSLPSGLVSIGNSSFYACSNLALTSLPSGLVSIEDYSFYACSKITSLTFEGTPETISQNSMQITTLHDVYVPWAEGEVANAPWGANFASIHYNHTS